MVPAKGLMVHYLACHDAMRFEADLLEGRSSDEKKGFNSHLISPQTLGRGTFSSKGWVSRSVHKIEVVTNISVVITCSIGNLYYN